MGVFDKFLNFGNSRRGKIISWAVVFVFVTFFFIGVTVTSIGSVSRPINLIKLEAQNMRETNIVDANGESFPGYHIELSELNTPITASTSPFRSSAPIRFSTDSDLIEIINPRITSGGVAIIRLKKAEGQYVFSEPLRFLEGSTSMVENDDIDNIRIDVRSGNKSEVIFVRIILRPAAIEIGTYLERNHRGIPTRWDVVSSVLLSDFTNFNNPLMNQMQYRVRFQLRIFDTVMLDTVERPDDLDYFTYQQLEVYEGFPIELFVEQDGANYLLITRNTPDAYIEFRVGVTFNDVEYFTRTPFRINIDL